jgi:hypothetical protein
MEDDFGYRYSPTSECSVEGDVRLNGSELAANLDFQEFCANHNFPNPALTPGSVATFTELIISMVRAINGLEHQVKLLSARRRP